MLQPRENIWKNFRLSYSWRVYCGFHLAIWAMMKFLPSLIYIWGLIINNEPQNKDPIINQSIFHGNFGPVFFRHSSVSIFISQTSRAHPTLDTWTKPPEFWKDFDERCGSEIPLPHLAGGADFETLRKGWELGCIPRCAEWDLFAYYSLKLTCPLKINGWKMYSLLK